MPDVGVDDRLEHLHRGLPVVRARRGRFLDEELGEPVDADQPRRAAAQHREHARARDAVGERVRELVDLDLLVAEVALHQLVVADDDAFDERVVDLVLLRLHLGRHRTLGAASVHLPSR